MTPTITALAPWFGSKRTLAPKIVEALGPHTSYFEPFAGGVSVIFAKPPSRCETLNDLHGDIINLARVVRCPVLGQELYRRARLTPCADDEFQEARRIVVGSACEPKEHDSTIKGGVADIDRAEMYLRYVWLGRNGEAGLDPREKESNLCVRWGDNGGSPAVRWLGVVRSIAVWRRRLARVTILRRDGFKLLAEDIRDEPGVAIYCDPPYLAKSDRYQHDFEDSMFVNHHRQLAEILERFRHARVVVSYYKHPDLPHLYRKTAWEWREFEVNKNLSNQGNGQMKPAGKAVEVLLCRN
jgi:DNA adenine methylase